MVYRDDGTCHICGADTRATCPACGEPVCEAHTLDAWAAEDPDGRDEVARRLALRLGGDNVCRACVEQEAALSVGEYVTVYRSGDPVVTQMLVEALADEGFDARALGTQNAALLGAGQLIFDQRIEVPKPQAERAAETVQSLLEASQLIETNDESLMGIGEDDEDDEDDGALVEADTPRKRGLAAGIALIFPGGSHMYTQRPYTGVMLTATFIAGLVVMANGATSAGAVLAAGAPMADLVGGQVAVGAHNRGETVSPLFQLLHGAVVAALLALVAAATI